MAIAKSSSRTVVSAVRAIRFPVLQFNPSRCLSTAAAAVDISDTTTYQAHRLPRHEPEPGEQQQTEAARIILRTAVAATRLRHDWTKKEIAAIYYQPLLELAFQAVWVP